MSKHTRFVICLTMFCLLTSIHAVSAHAQNLIRGTEPGGPRDRDYAFCDPAANPRELRGDYIDCSTVISPTPGQPPNGQPSPTPGGEGGGGGTGGVPTSAPTPLPTGTSSGSSSSDDDPCAPGKSYTGSYCGWSPSTSDNGGGGGSTSYYEDSRIGGPAIAGLSYTAGAELTPSDIIMFAGILCLLVYVKSKLTLIGKSRSRVS